MHRRSIGRQASRVNKQAMTHIYSKTTSIRGLSMDERMLKAMVAAGAIGGTAQVNLADWQPDQRELSV